MLKNKILSSVGGEEKLYSNDVFTSYVRTGTGADAVINTGIDMTKGYMLWSKSRSAATDHAVYDSARGITLDLVTNSTAAQTTQSTGLKAVSSTGHTVGSLAKMNTSGATYVDWVWKKAPKFFDVVTYTGNGVLGRVIPHGLGVAPGMIIVKSTSGSTTDYPWMVYHRGIGATKYLQLETTAAAATWQYAWNNTEPTDTGFTVSSNTNTNASGQTYAAYIFAHDPSADGIIQCGSFTTDGSGNATVNLGWEPQYLMVKPITGTYNWRIYDTARGFGAFPNPKQLLVDQSNAEDSGNAGTQINATGFKFESGASSTTHIYLTIRRPNKPPTTGTEVYNAIARTGTGATATVTGVGFAPDLYICSGRPSFAGKNWVWTNRLTGNGGLSSDNIGAEFINTAVFASDVFSTSMDGVRIQTANPVNSASYTYINHFFKRSPGFMDIVCYTGTGVARTVPHSLGVAPELIIVKSRKNGASAGALDWSVYSVALGATDFLYLNWNFNTQQHPSHWNNTPPTSSGFTVGNQARTNETGADYIAYLFATKTGISKVGNYTGNGTTQTINCGFTTGARFILIKATSTAGNWIVADSTRGILSSADPALYLNSTAAEVTGVDWVDPNIVGFDIIQEGTMNANVNGTNYIYLAIS